MTEHHVLCLTKQQAPTYHTWGHKHGSTITNDLAQAELILKVKVALALRWFDDMVPIPYAEAKAAHIAWELTGTWPLHGRHKQIKEISSDEQ